MNSVHLYKLVQRITMHAQATRNFILAAAGAKFLGNVFLTPLQLARIGTAARAADALAL